MGKNDCSYGRYRQYRMNKRRYAITTGIVPMIIFFYLFSNIWNVIYWILVGIVGICLFSVSKDFLSKQRKYIVDEIDKKIEVVDECNKEYERLGKRMNNMKSTDIGYVNRNNQKNIGKTNQIGTDYAQWFYNMECLNCGNIYKANGSDIWQRKCPNCQGGRK